MPDGSGQCGPGGSRDSLKRFLAAEEGSTVRLVQLCVGYFSLYAVTGVAVKYFLGKSVDGMPGLKGPELLVYSTIGGTALNVLLVFALRWYRLQSNRTVNVLGFQVPSELAYILPSGLCTAVVIPTTTLMYTLPISVMVAMTIMRGSVIIISRVVDALQIRQGILKRKVVPEENIAVGFALMAVGTNVVSASDGGFDFLQNGSAMTILGAYISAYAFRIYLMNYFKNTRQKGVKQDNKGFFAWEQMAASSAILLTGLVLYFSASDSVVVGQMRGAIDHPPPAWLSAFLFAGLPFGAVAVFSVFIFMFKGRTATFAGLVNRLTSLIAGTAATLLFATFFGGRYPGLKAWVGLGFILIAVAFLRSAERKRATLARAETPEKRPTPAVT